MVPERSSLAAMERKGVGTKKRFSWMREGLRESPPVRHEWRAIAMVVKVKGARSITNITKPMITRSGNR